MSDFHFFVDRDGYGVETIYYGKGPDALDDHPDVIVERTVLDRQNLVLWRKVVHALTGEWTACDNPICHWEERRHEGTCRTYIGGGA